MTLREYLYRENIIPTDPDFINSVRNLFVDDQIIPEADINDYLDIMAVWYRDILLFKATHDMNHLIFRDEISSIQKVAAASAYEGIEEVIGALDTAKTRLKSSVDYELTMELLMLTIKENVAG